MSNKKISKMHQRALDSKKAKAINDNNFWDDCNAHYDMSTQAIHKVEGTLAEDLEVIVNTPELMSEIKDVVGLESNLTILRKDITDHVARLNDIKENHKDKTGGIKTPEEGVEVIQINGKYQEAMEIYNANVIPVVCHIYEQIAPAQKKLYEMIQKLSEEDKQKQDITDPNVVSDAVVKGE